MDSYPGAETYLEKALIKEGTTVNYYGKPVYMNWHNNDENKKAIFYNIGKGGYVLGYNIASLNGRERLVFTAIHTFMIKIVRDFLLIKEVELIH